MKDPGTTDKYISFTDGINAAVGTALAQSFIDVGISPEMALAKLRDKNKIKPKNKNRKKNKAARRARKRNSKK